MICKFKATIEVLVDNSEIFVLLLLMGSQSFFFYFFFI